MTIPSAELSQLHRADGSATYSSGGYTVIGAVNGPIEVTRRDELPEEAAIEVNVRPASGIGSTIVSLFLIARIINTDLHIFRSQGTPS